MKNFFIYLFIFSTSQIYSFECNKKVDEKRVVFYMAYHGAGVELEAAEKGACERGEKFVSYPDKVFLKLYSQKSKELKVGFYQDKFRALDTNYLNCSKQKNVDCSRILSERNKYASLYSNSQNSLYKWNQQNSSNLSGKKALEALVKNLKSTGGSLTSIILSGHDGGGIYYGSDYEDSISKNNIFEIAKNNPEQFSKLNSAILMGCWSAVPNEIEEWKNHLPQLKLISGFAGSAPSSERSSSGSFIFDSLKLSDRIIHSKSSVESKSIIDSFQDFDRINSGIYFDLRKKDCPATMGNNQYYYVSKANSRRAVSDYYDDNKKYEGVGLHKFKSSESTDVEKQCKHFNNTMNWKELNRFYYGDEDPSYNLELKELYSKFRNNEHCKKYINFAYTPDQILLLRFNKDVSKNFASYYKNGIMAARIELLNWLNSDKISDSEKKNIKNAIDLNLFSPKGIANISRKDLSKLISGLELLQHYYPGKLSQCGFIKNRMAKNLFALKCLDPTWHEFNEGLEIAPPQC